MPDVLESMLKANRVPTAEFRFEWVVFPVLVNDEPHGTGFCIKDGGLVATAAHVVQGRDAGSLGIRNLALGKDFQVDFKREHSEADIAVLGVLDQEMRNCNPFMLGSSYVWRKFQLPLSFRPNEPDKEEVGRFAVSFEAGNSSASGNLSGWAIPYPCDETGEFITARQSVGVGDRLEAFGYFTHRKGESVQGRLLQGSVQRSFVEQSIYRYKAFECSFDNALHSLSGAPVMLEGDWGLGLVKGIVTKRESLDDDEGRPTENLWTNCLLLTEEIRRWIFDSFREWNPGGS